jgi:hypothetical protein
MLALEKTLQDQDPGRLRIIAELWGFDSPTGSPKTARAECAARMLDPINLDDMLAGLPPAAQQTLTWIQGRGGRAPLADLIRLFGELRDFGPGKRDRQAPWRRTVSPVEDLWYRGLIGRAFADTPTGPLEFAFIPSDLLASLPPPPAPPEAPIGRRADPPPVVIAAGATLFDDTVTLLAMLRCEPEPQDELPTARRTALQPFLYHPPALDLILAISHEAGLISGPGLTSEPDAVRQFLDQPRTAAEAMLARAWMHSTSWNDLAHTPGLAAGQAAWPNDPLASRIPVLDFIRGLPTDAWWSLLDLIQAMYAQQPGFQRPGGDFDSWYLRRMGGGQFLRGFGHWHQVEGALIKFLVTGPLHWLGFVDLGDEAYPSGETGFRLTAHGQAWLRGDLPAPVPSASHPTKGRLLPDGLIHIPRLCPATLRYQVSRLTLWVSREDETYIYRLTPQSMERAAQQGLRHTHALAILVAAAGRTPPHVEQAIRRLAQSGPPANLERTILFRIDHPELRRQLEGRRSLARFLSKPAGPGQYLIEEKDWPALTAALARIGFLIGAPIGEGKISP